MTEFTVLNFERQDVFECKWSFAYLLDQVVQVDLVDLKTKWTYTEKGFLQTTKVAKFSYLLYYSLPKLYFNYELSTSF